MTIRLRTPPIIAVALLTACMVASVAVYASGASSPTGRLLAAQVTTGPYLLTDPDLAATPASSPSRAVLTWWRSLQYLDYRGAYELLAARLRRSLSLVAFTREAGLAAPTFFLKPRVAGTALGRSRAKVYVQLQAFAKGRLVAIQPETFSLLGERGVWRLADDRFLSMKASEAVAAQHSPSGAATR